MQELVGRAVRYPAGRNPRDSGMPAALAALADRLGARSLSRHPGWLPVLEKGLRQHAYCIEASVGGDVAGIFRCTTSAVSCLGGSW